MNFESGSTLSSVGDYAFAGSGLACCPVTSPGATLGDSWCPVSDVCPYPPPSTPSPPALPSPPAVPPVPPTSPRPPSSPPLLPGQRASISGDPHIHGAHGDRADFKGADGGVCWGERSEKFV